MRKFSPNYMEEGHLNEDPFSGFRIQFINSTGKHTIKHSTFVRGGVSTTCLLIPLSVYGETMRV
jgi:hypothetical protein